MTYELLNLGIYSYMKYEIWNHIYDIWNMKYEIWNLIYDIWNMI